MKEEYMSSKKDELRWSTKFKLFISTLASIVLFGSYFMSVLADNAKDAGKMDEAFILGMLSMISLPAALLVTAMVAWRLLFNVPTEKSPKWMKAKLGNKELNV